MQQRSTQITVWTMAGALALAFSTLVLMAVCNRVGLPRPVLIGACVLGFVVCLAVGAGVSWMVGGGGAGVLCALGSAILYSVCYGFWTYMQFADQLGLSLVTIWVKPLVSTGVLMAVGGLIGSWLRSRQRRRMQ